MLGERLPQEIHYLIGVVVRARFPCFRADPIGTAFFTWGIGWRHRRAPFDWCRVGFPKTSYLQWLDPESARFAPCLFQLLELFGLVTSASPMASSLLVRGGSDLVLDTLIFILHLAQYHLHPVHHLDFWLFFLSVGRASHSQSRHSYCYCCWRLKKHPRLA
jgi:hypothetical protein